MNPAVERSPSDLSLGMVELAVPASDLRKLVRNYKIAMQARRLDEIQWIAGQPDFRSAIQVSARSVTKSGKRHNHQRRLSRDTVATAEASLLAAEDELRGCTCFDELINLVKTKIGWIKGAGALYVYDVSLRLGWFVDVHPTYVYLHAGARVGAKYVGASWREHASEPASLPKELHSLTPAEIEDFLCVMKTHSASLPATHRAAE